MKKNYVSPEAEVVTLNIVDAINNLDDESQDMVSGAFNI